MEQPLLNEHEAAKLLRISVQLLRKWRANGFGPKYIKQGSKCVRYKPSEIAGFIDAQASRLLMQPIQ